MTVQRTSLLFFFLLIVVACGPNGEEAEGEVAPAGAETAVSDAFDVSSLRALPPLGKTEIRISGQVVTLLANEAPLIEVLELFARSANFELTLGELRKEEAGDVYVYLDNVSFADALTRVLAGIPFTLDFGVDPDDGSSFLRRVRVGILPDDGASRVAKRQARKQGGDFADKRAERREKRAKRKANRRSPEELARLAEQRRERAEWASAELDNADWEIREDAASKIDVDDPRERERLEDLLKNDPSAEVRIAAMERLTDGDSSGVLDILFGALDDPDPEVVIEALDQIEFEGDESTVSRLEGCLTNPNPTIAARCLEAIEFLE